MLMVAAILLASAAEAQSSNAGSMAKILLSGQVAKKSLVKKGTPGNKKAVAVAARSMLLSPSKTFLNVALPNSAYPGVNSVAISSDGTLVAAATQDGMVKLWDVSLGTVRFTMKDPRMSSIDSNKFQSPASSVAYSPDGRTVASGSRAGTVLFNAQSGQMIRTYNNTMTSALAFSPNGQVIAAVSAGIQMDPNHTGEVNFLDANSGAILLTIPGVKGGVTSIAFSPDGKTLASAGVNGEVILWEVSSGQKLGNFDSHAQAGNQHYARALAFSPNGQMLATAGGTNTPWQGVLKLWNVQNGALIKTITDGQPMQSIAFSHDGSKIATANWDKSIKVFAAPSLSLLATTKVFMGNRSVATSSDGHGGAVNSVVFSADDKWLYSGSEDHSNKGWQF
jgi:WD40 repeat protein